MRVLFLRQEHLSRPGPVGEAFVDRGYDVEEFLIVPAKHSTRPDVTLSLPDPVSFDAVVPLGAPWSVYDTTAIGSWIDEELRFLRQADAAGVPVLGICFGGQAVAAALGGSVRRADEGEFGWRRVDSDAPELIEPGPWFEWHQDRWECPPGAVEVARTSASSQAFVLRRNLAVQFHPELTEAQLQDWLDNGGAEYLVGRGVDAGAVYDETARQGPAAARRSRRLVHRFLDRVARQADGVTGTP